MPGGEVHPLIICVLGEGVDHVCKTTLGKAVALLLHGRQVGPHGEEGEPPADGKVHAGDGTVRGIARPEHHQARVELELTSRGGVAFKSDRVGQLHRTLRLRWLEQEDGLAEHAAQIAAVDLVNDQHMASMRGATVCPEQITGTGIKAQPRVSRLWRQPHDEVLVGAGRVKLNHRRVIPGEGGGHAQGEPGLPGAGRPLQDHEAALRQDCADILLADLREDLAQHLLLPLLPSLPAGLFSPHPVLVKEEVHQVFHGS